MMKKLMFSAVTLGILALGSLQLYAAGPCSLCFAEHRAILSYCLTLPEPDQTQCKSDAAETFSLCKQNFCY